MFLTQILWFRCFFIVFQFARFMIISAIMFLFVLLIFLLYLIGFLAYADVLGLGWAIVKGPVAITVHFIMNVLITYVSTSNEAVKGTYPCFRLCSRKKQEGGSDQQGGN